jgi:outer membrane receptor protein involved in Fe transport
VWGYETEIQTNLAWVQPRFLRGIVLSVNYSRLFSETETLFLTSETVFSGGFPPIPVTTYFENERTVSMPSQAPQIFRASLGYDVRGFSVRVSSSYQGTKARSYNFNKDFDSYDLQFWRWDASAKQQIGERWSVFLNLNNISNQQDIRFTRNETYIRSIETYGFTGTIGVQYRY